MPSKLAKGPRGEQANFFAKEVGERTAYAVVEAAVNAENGGSGGPSTLQVPGPSSDTQTKKTKGHLAILEVWQDIQAAGPILEGVLHGDLYSCWCATRNA